ncbi:MAG: homoserine dehydrogenase [Fimbriimonadaceae bacterium]|nr:homoserine dehydrogenase [Fimbriimonadaceae bacterium]
MKEVRVGLMGCGVVGSALAEILCEEHAVIAASSGVRLRLGKTLVRDVAKVRHGAAERLVLTDCLDVALEDRQEIVVELIGGDDVALRAVRRSLRAGKNVVTANKVILARYGEQLAELAHRKGCSLAYEASVGSCIPVLQSLDHTLASERFSALAGILNGTCNYILTRMERDGLGYEDAVREAQKKGLAEADPAADVSGSDAACKLVILARKAFNASLRPADVPTEGIESVSARDLAFAKTFGCAIRLLATARRSAAGLELRVGPHLVPFDHPFATVRNESNAMQLDGDSVGRLFFAGPGAGAKPTARAVLGDILSIATGERDCVPGRRSLDLERPLFRPAADAENRYYLRLSFDDQPHVLAGATRILDACGVEVHRVEALGAGHGDIVFLTHSTTRGRIQSALARLKRLRFLSEAARAFPVYDDQGDPS